MIQTQWDNLANIRLLQILSGQDITYNRVLMPTVFDTIGARRFSRCLDVGCGVGVLTSALQARSQEVVGIDISPKSAQLASKTFGGERLRFLNESIEAHVATNVGRYDLVIANMFLMDTIDLQAASDAIGSVALDGSVILVIVPHPGHWPQHYGYGSANWFEYSREMAIECNFHISLSSSDLSTVHFHRPLESYFRAFLASKLELTTFRELMPSDEVRALYPVPWKGPRYVLFELKKRQLDGRS